MILENRWFQDEAEQSLFDFFEMRRGLPGNPVVAMPTGTGKSVVIAKFVNRAMKTYPATRIMMLTHVKELIEQNAKKLYQVWNNAPLGINSAGLDQRDIALPIIYGGVRSVKKNIEAFGYRDMLVIDEAHLLSSDAETEYQQVIAGLVKINPYLKVIGFTATPFRMKQGMITDGGIFTDICYDATSPQMFNRLIAEGFISPPIPKRTEAYIDTSNVKIVGGEFSAGALEAAADKDEITYAAVRETVEFGYNRACWLMFASGINHAEHIAAMLQSFGISAAAVHCKKSQKENDQILKDLKSGILRAVVSMGKLTTGFDHPPIDLIGMLRPTLSPGLWVQMLGRGTRPYDPFKPGDVNPLAFPNLKQNVLVMDFARNTPRLGPINDPKIPGKPGKGGGDAPVRICEEGYRYKNGVRYAANDGCGAYNHSAVRNCINCHMEFDFSPKIFKSAGDDKLLREDADITKHFEVQRAIYAMHNKPNSPPTMKVSYFCGYQVFNEWVCLEHSGLAGKRARDWWRQRHLEDPPQFIWEALQRSSELRVPSRIRVIVNKNYPEIVGHEY